VKCAAGLALCPPDVGSHRARKWAAWAGESAARGRGRSLAASSGVHASPEALSTPRGAPAARRRPSSMHGRACAACRRPSFRPCKGMCGMPETLFQAVQGHVRHAGGPLPRMEEHVRHAGDPLPRRASASRSAEVASVGRFDVTPGSRAPPRRGGSGGSRVGSCSSNGEATVPPRGANGAREATRGGALALAPAPRGLWNYFHACARQKERRGVPQEERALCPR